jgi:hypothetical protein
MTNIHDADLLWVEGVNTINCDWRHVDQKRWDIIDKVLQLAKPPYKIYRVLAERETGYMSLSKENKDFHFEIIEKTYLSNLSLIGIK